MQAEITREWVTYKQAEELSGLSRTHIVEASDRWRNQGGSRWARRSHQSPFSRWVPGAGCGRFIGRLGGL